MQKLKIGDVVRQTSTKVKMTVHSIKGAKVVCDWFVGAKLHRETFKKDELIIVS